MRNIGLIYDSGKLLKLVVYLTRCGSYLKTFEDNLRYELGSIKPFDCFSIHEPGGTCCCRVCAKFIPYPTRVGQFIEC